VVQGSWPEEVGVVRRQLRDAALTWHAVGEEVIVLDLEGSVYLKLNGSGRLLWERLAEGCTDGELAAALVERYRVAPERASADVDAFVAELRRRELLAR
jgi:Coenzyme PQQ synthesis protein D (PqqD)